MRDAGDAESSLGDAKSSLGNVQVVRIADIYRVDNSVLSICEVEVFLGALSALKPTHQSVWMKLLGS